MSVTSLLWLMVAGVQLGAVDFLAKPLSPLKLQNIWQHTVRKMMSNMNINCSSTVPAADMETAAAANAAMKKELDAMEVIMEEPEAELAAVEVNTDHRVSASSVVDAADDRAQKVKESVPNAALAASSSFFEPTKNLSRSGSLATADSSSTVLRSGVTDSLTGSPKLLPKKHAAVHACPSTRSLTSMSSCYSNLQLSLPESPSANEFAEGKDAPAGQGTAGAASMLNSPSPSSVQQQQRCVKKAVRHATPASKPPLGKSDHKGSGCVVWKGSTMGPCSGATTAGPLPLNIGMTQVPLPTGLGPLPQGMVWGMPMCPLARAPGIVPPKTNSTDKCSQQTATASSVPGVMGVPPMSMPWGFMSMPNPFMPGFVMPPMPMAMPFGPYMGVGMSCFAGQGTAMDSQHTQMASGAMGVQQDAAAAAAAPVPLEQMPQAGTASTGAAAAAALNASWNADGCIGGEDPAAGMDLNDAFDFMLGDITAEDDLDVGMPGLLDSELAQLEKDGLKLPTELQELQACQRQQEQLQQQYHQRTSFDCSTMTHHPASQRISFDCHSSARHRVSFDCSTASTSTAGRISFDCSTANAGSRPAKSQRVSFEVNCPAGKPLCQITPQSSMTPGLPAQGCSSAAFCKGSDPLLGSMSDLFAACSGDSCSEGSNGMTHVDSCGMLADLQSLFGPADCARDEGCSTGTGAAAALFDDVMEDLPLELAMKKNSSLADLLHAGLPPIQA